MSLRVLILLILQGMTKWDVYSKSLLMRDIYYVLAMGNPAIVEKDYYVVALLKLLSELSTDTH